MKPTKQVIIQIIIYLSLLIPVAQAADSTAADKLGWKLGVQCWTFRKLTFVETVDRIHQLGLKYVEMFPGQKLKPDSDAVVGPGMPADVTAEVKAKLKAADVQLVSFGVASIPKGEDTARKLFKWAKKMGIEVIVTETVPTEIIDKLSGEFGIKVAIHNHPKTWPPDQILAATKDLSPRIGSGADTGHWKRAGFDTVEQIKKLGSRTIHSHFKDVAPVEGQPGKFLDAPWGTGQGNAAAMLTELKNQGYQGYFIIEYEYGTVDELMTNLPKCILFFYQTAAQLAK